MPAPELTIYFDGSCPLCRRVLGWLCACPPMSWGLEWAYRAFLPLRPRLQRLVRRWSPDTEAAR